MKIADGVESSPLENTQNNSQYVLVVNNSFPSNGGSRVDKFVKFLPQFGFTPIVLCAHECTPQDSSAILADLYPTSLEIYHARSLGWSYFTERYLDRGSTRKYYTLLKWLSFPERFVYMPDHMVRWIPHGILLARKIVKSHGIRFVFTSSPPASTHLIGLYLKQKFGIHWVADFRDLWTESNIMHRPATPIHDHWIREMEGRIFSEADHVIANTPDNYAHYLRRFSIPENKVSFIPNGFDRDDQPSKVRENKNSGIFQIGHMGNFDKQNYPWRQFLNALKLLAQQVGQEKIQFVHCGFYSNEVEAYLKDNSMEGIVVNHGMLQHRYAVRTIASTSLRLVLLGESDENKMLTPPKVPAKLYNYLIMDGPVLAIAPENCDVSRILEETRMGIAVTPEHGTEKIFDVLLSYFRMWEQDELSTEPNYDQVSLYDRQTQAGRLAEIMRSMDDCIRS